MSNTEKISQHAPKVIAWVEFEKEVADFVEKTIPAGKWGVCVKLSKVLRKPKYYSKDREKDIIFDASIEVRPADDPEQLHFLWLIECKNYPSRTVTVDEVEEFHSKMVQVKANKGTVFTLMGFDSGAITFAKSNRIGLATLQKEELVTIQCSADGGAFAETIVTTPFFMDGDIERSSSLTEVLSRTMSQFGVLMLPANLGKRRIAFEGAEYRYTSGEND